MLTPSQLSATSHASAAGRQTAVLFVSAGQLGPAPVQLSAGSQAPAEGRHTTIDGAKSSGGQSLLTPSQSSATSHTSAAGRQTPMLLRSGGHTSASPVQLSTASHAPAAGRQASPAGRNMQLDVQQESLAPFAAPRSHSSSRSRIPSPQTSALAAVGMRTDARARTSRAMGRTPMDRVVSNHRRHSKLYAPGR